jgi:hypothetical protein
MSPYTFIAGPDPQCYVTTVKAEDIRLLRAAMAENSSPI